MAFSIIEPIFAFFQTIFQNFQLYFRLTKCEKSLKNNYFHKYIGLYRQNSKKKIFLIFHHRGPTGGVKIADFQKIENGKNRATLGQVLGTFRQHLTKNN